VNLVERAEQAKEAAAAQARADIALIRSILDRIKADFYQVGLLLKRLKDSRAAAALGYAGFNEMCKAELELSATAVDGLVRIVENYGPDLARRLGRSQALALLKLCDATPEDDTVQALATGTVRLPSGATLDVAGSSVREKEEAAKAIREATGAAKPAKGRTTTADDRRVAAEVEKALRAAGLRAARVRAVATQPSRPSDLRLEGIPVDGLPLLCKALCVRRRK
jgi:hypothetical protein